MTEDASHFERMDDKDFHGQLVCCFFAESEIWRPVFRKRRTLTFNELHSLLKLNSHWQSMVRLHYVIPFEMRYALIRLSSFK